MSAAQHLMCLYDLQNLDLDHDLISPMFAGARQNAARATQMAKEKIIEARRERLRHARRRAAGAKGWLAVLKLHAATAWLARRLNANAVRRPERPPTSSVKQRKASRATKSQFDSNRHAFFW